MSKSKPKQLAWPGLVLIATLLSACARVAALAPAPTEAPAADPGQFIFGVILVGPKDDHGWSEAHFAGGRYVEANLAGSAMVSLDSLNPEARPEMTLAEAVGAMAAVHSRLIFVTSDDFAADTSLSAEAYPDVTFVHISGDHVLTGKAPANLGNYMGRMEYGKSMAGCAAALATETGTVGYLGPLVNNETQRLANSAYLGARYCYQNYRQRDPDDLRFLIEFIGFWFYIPEVTLDPTQVANRLYDQGADVVLSGIDTTEALSVAVERAGQGEKVWAVPYDYEGACDSGPQVCLGVPYFNWGPGYLALAQEVQAGRWTQRWDWAGPDWQDINNHDTSAIGFRKGPALGEEQAAQLDQFIAGLADGSIDLFKGPLDYEDGSQFLGADQVATDKDIWYTSQLLKGMTGLSQ